MRNVPRAPRHAWCSWLALGLAACGSPAPPAASPATPRVSAAPDLTALKVALAGVDARLARRLGHVAKDTSHLFPEEAPASRIPALFDFDARLAVLRRAEAALAETPQAPERLLVRQELARLENERELPRSGSAIVRSLVPLLPAPFKPSLDAGQRASVDEGLAKCLDRIGVSLKDGALGPMQLAEMDDSLDAFERGAAGLVATSAAVARLRISIQGSPPHRGEVLPGWEVTRRRVELFAGPLPADLSSALVVAERAFASANGAALNAPRQAREESGSRALARLVGPAASEALPLPAPEQVPLHALLEALAQNEDPAGLLELSLVLGRWALALHQDRTLLANVEGPRGLALDESDQARALRFALVRPEEALTLALAASTVLPAPAARARAWLAMGVPRPGDVRDRLP